MKILIVSFTCLVGITVAAELYVQTIIDAQPVSYVQSVNSEIPTSYSVLRNVTIANNSKLIPDYKFEIKDGTLKKKVDGKLANLDFNEGVLDKNKGFFYFTTKSASSWGADKYINVYSLAESRVVKQIEFDNSGYFKYPISISPDSKILVLAERSQSAGEVSISIIDLQTGAESKSRDKLYSPEVKWIDESNYVYLSTTNNCKKGWCYQESLDMKKYNYKNGNSVKKKLFGREQDGSLPQIDKFEVENNDITFSNRAKPMEGKYKPIKFDF